jgi:hypothetical protein
MTWALALPKAALENPAARHVLLCLANYAGSDGRGAFPSANTLSEDTGLSERTIRLKLSELEASGWIVEGNQAIAAAYIDRRDRRPVVYDLQMKRGANPAPRKERGADNRTGCSSQQSGVQENAERGAAAAPNPSLNHQLTEKQQREISDVVCEQDRQALAEPELPAETRQRFGMFADWVPDGNQLGSQLFLVGMPGHVADAKVINTFKGYYLAKSNIRDTNPGWAHRLAKWIKREQVEKAAAPDFNDQSWRTDASDDL